MGFTWLCYEYMKGFVTVIKGAHNCFLVPSRGLRDFQLEPFELGKKVAEAVINGEYNISC